MVMINQFDLIGDTDGDDPLLIALAQLEIIRKKAAAAAVAAAAAADAAAAAAAASAAATAATAAADQELLVEEAEKGVLDVPQGAVPYQERRGQNGRGRSSGRNFENNRNGDGRSSGRNFENNRNGDGRSSGRNFENNRNGDGRNSGRNFENNRNGDGFSAVSDGRGRGYGYGRNFENNRNVDVFFAVPDGRGRGSGRNFENNRNVDFSAVPADSPQELLGKPSIRGHSDQPYRGHGGGRGRGYLNRDNGEYNGRPADRQFDRRSGLSSSPANFKGEPAPPVKDVPVPQVELGTPEQNLKENATLEGKSSIPKETVELYNGLNKDKEGMSNGRQEKEPWVKVKTLVEYQREMEEKRKILASKPEMKKTQERKVDVDKEFQSMQQLLVKKENNEFFIKLGNDKEAGKRKEVTGGDERLKKVSDGDEGVKKDTNRVERVKKSVGMFEFLRLAEGRRGGRGGRGGQGGHGGRGDSNSFSDESVKDPQQFPTLGGKEVEQQHSSAQWKKVEQQHSSAQGRK